MLIESKVRSTRKTEDNKSKIFTEYYLIDCESYSDAEYKLNEYLHDAEKFDIISMKLTSISEIYDNYEGTSTFTATMSPEFEDDYGQIKTSKYSILLWANDLFQANQRIDEISKQGYQMQVEGIKQSHLIYIK